MTWGQALTGLIVLVVVSGGITYVVTWLRSRAHWARSRRNIVRDHYCPRASWLWHAGNTTMKLMASD